MLKINIGQILLPWQPMNQCFAQFENTDMNKKILVFIYKGIYFLHKRVLNKYDDYFMHLKCCVAHLKACVKFKQVQRPRKKL